jgi:hypothetical protein
MSEEEEYHRMADGLEEVAKMMQHYAKVLRGEEKDMTGRGAWTILCDRLSRVMNCKVITLEQYKAFKKLSDQDFEGRYPR